MKFYRYDIGYGRNISVDLLEFTLVKETPKGYWIAPYLTPLWVHSDKHWIPKVSRKRFAYPTKEEALESFIIRKKKQIQYAQRDAFNAETALQIAEKMREEYKHKTESKNIPI